MAARQKKILALEDFRQQADARADFSLAHVKPGGQAGVGRYTDVWQRRQERWLCVAAHVSRG